MNLVSIGIIAGVILVALFVLGLILTRLYRRASKEVSFVRTGFGGEKVIMNGGAMVLPVLHEIIPVNMNTLRLEVLPAGRAAGFLGGGGGWGCSQCNEDIPPKSLTKVRGFSMSGI